MRPTRFLTLLFLPCLTVFVAPAQSYSEDQPPPEPAPEKKSKPRTVYKPEPEKMYKLLPLKEIEYETVEAVCKDMLSKGGLMTYEKTRRSVLVYDTEEVIAKIRAFLEEVDRDPVNIRINIDFTNVTSKSGGGLVVERKSKPPFPGQQPAVVVDGKKVVWPDDDIKIKAGVRRGTEINNASQFVVTKSGSPASIWVGKEMLDPTWVNAIRHYLQPTIIVIGGGSVIKIPGTDVDFKWARVGQSLKVLPRYRDDGVIDVEIYPEFTFLDGKGRRQAVKVESLSTRLSVRDGARINIGGALSKKSEDLVSLFGPDFVKSDGSSGVFDMVLTATVIKGDGTPSRAPAKDDYSDPHKAIFRR